MLGTILKQRLEPRPSRCWTLYESGLRKTKPLTISGGNCAFPWWPGAESNRAEDSQSSCLSNFLLAQLLAENEAGILIGERGINLERREHLVKQETKEALAKFLIELFIFLAAWGLIAWLVEGNGWLHLIFATIFTNSVKGQLDSEQNLNFLDNSSISLMNS